MYVFLLFDSSKATAPEKNGQKRRQEYKSRDKLWTRGVPHGTQDELLLCYQANIDPWLSRQLIF